jgi:hypothetical protein
LRSAAVAVTLATLIILAASSAATKPALAQNTSPSPASLPPGAPARPSCGWNNPANSTALVASSPAGSAVVVTIGEPSWQQDCISSRTPGGGGSTSSSVAYEVFPIAVHASPNTTITLQTGEAVPTAQQVAEGIHSATLWTWFNPGTVETNPTGVARSNLTLAGAVMPFVPNDVANVTLPIVASASTGLNGSVGLPIEFEGGVSAVLRSVGPITFGGGIQVQANGSASPRFDAVYSPPGSSSSSAPLQVSMSILGTYKDGSIGPLPLDVQVSFPQQTLELPPHSLVYFNVDETNTLKPSNSSAFDTYTFAVQERVDNATYVVPLVVSVSLEEIIFGRGWATIGTSLAGPASTTPPNSQTAGVPGSERIEIGVALATVALVAVVAVVLGLERRAKAVVPAVEPT